MSKSAVIFMHEKNEGPGTFGDILEERGFRLRVVATPAEDIAALDPLTPDLLLVMGGPMGVYEASRYPFLKQEIEFLKKRMAADKATLGICLGSQLMAAALGEEVFKGKKGQEIGWNPLKLTAAAARHPVRHLTGETTNMFHWHGDTYALPKGATLLASSSLYENQIYSYGKNALALQCHPEVSLDQALEWARLSPQEIARSQIEQDPGTLEKTTIENMEIMSRQARKFLTEWLEERGL
jgi:GMP synthase (glutamine-hydrolysing)